MGIREYLISPWGQSWKTLSQDCPHGKVALSTSILVNICKKRKTCQIAIFYKDIRRKAFFTMATLYCCEIETIVGKAMQKTNNIIKD